MSTALQPIAVSIGDPAGIGPEVLAKAWQQRREQRLSPFFAIGDRRSIAAVWDGPLRKIGAPDEARACFDEALPIMEVEDAGEIAPGAPNMPGARCAIASLEIAVGLARENAVSAIVTGPVAKAALYAAGFTHSGQTEFVAERCGVAPGNVAMMLAGPTLRTVCITTHVPLAEVSALLSVELVVARARVAAKGLQRDFGIEMPRLALAGFNPHAGEGGALGREEIDILLPALEQLREDGIDIVGPLAADTMFHPRARALRRGAVHLSRPGADSAQDAALRRGRQHDAGAPDHPRRARSRYRLRDRRREPGRARRDDRGDPHGRRVRRAPRALRVTSMADLPPLREVIARHGLAASKALGQNFLLDPQLLDRIARVAGDLQGQRVYEVGPGPGGLTRALLRAGADVVAVERDRRCLPALAELAEAADGRLRVIEGDAMAVDAAAEAGRGAHIVANLPYNVGTALLVRWLEPEAWPPWWSSLSLMFQKEVAERIVARPGSDHFGRLSVLAQWRSRATIALNVHRSAFVPPPKVMSAVVHIVPGAMPAGVDPATLSALTAAAFGQRRKMLRQSLKAMPGALDALATLRIASDRRPETLSVDEFVAVAKTLS